MRVNKEQQIKLYVSSNLHLPGVWAIEKTRLQKTFA